MARTVVVTGASSGIGLASAVRLARARWGYLVGRDAHLRSWIERLPTPLRDGVLTRALLD